MKESNLSHNVDGTVKRHKSEAHDAIDIATNASSQAAEALRHKGEQLQDVEQLLFKNCRRYIQANPATSLGIAVGVGFLISRLLSSR